MTNLPTPGLRRQSILRWGAILMVAAALCTVALFAQLRALGVSRFGYFDSESALEYVERGNQLTRHQAVLNGDAPSPWQYRVLSAWVNEAAIRLFRNIGSERPVVSGFLTVRWIQNFAILVLCAAYYRRLGLSDGATFLGLSLFALSMSQAVYDSDLSTNVYFDVFFFLLSGLLIVRDLRIWVIPVVAAAALNRETSALIPLLLLAGGIEWSRRPRVTRNNGVFAAAAGTVFLAVFLGLRIVIGPRPLYEPTGISTGFERMAANFGDPAMWLQLGLTFGVVPLISVFALGSVPKVLKDFWLLMVPIWIAVHLVISVVAETRLFLVPMAMVFVPCTLFLVTHRSSSPST